MCSMWMPHSHFAFQMLLFPAGGVTGQPPASTSSMRAQIALFDGFRDAAIRAEHYMGRRHHTHVVDIKPGPLERHVQRFGSRRHNCRIVESGSLGDSGRSTDLLFRPRERECGSIHQRRQRASATSARPRVSRPPPGLVRWCWRCTPGVSPTRRRGQVDRQLSSDSCRRRTTG